MESVYQNPLISRYASREMAQLFGDQRKFRTWRKLWVFLAEAQQELGLPIDTQQIEEMKANVDNINWEAAAEHERKLRHDVMAHVHTFGDVCPLAKPIIHLGATSCYVTDNTDLMLICDGLQLLAHRLATVIHHLAQTAQAHRNLPCLGWTHLQPAQPTTVGKRACLWAYDLVLDLQEIEYRLEQLKARGAKGTTGTQASFLSLFQGDQQKVQLLDQIVSEKMGFKSSYAVTGQTYTRKVDFQVLSALSGVAQSAHKAATDWRLLQSRKELDEPSEAAQIGSSAMAYKRNPMRSERICALSRFAMSLESNAAATMATQWMERTLDDSANRRIIIPQAFLAVDAVLLLYQNVVSGWQYYPRVIARHLAEELPFMATETILMAAVAAGGDRQVLHEKIRVHSNAAAALVKQEGLPNDLLQRIQQDPSFSAVDVSELTSPNQFIGRAAEQVDAFLAEQVEPIRQRYAEYLTRSAEIRV